MIEVENLSKYYGSFLAVDNISFKVEEGEIVGFLGPNGAGKTTTMRVLSCFMPASSGIAKVAGYDVFSDSMKVRQNIGYLPEVPPLYPEMTVSKYLMYVATLKGLSKKKSRERLEVIIDRCGLEEVKNLLMKKLSKGYRQRVGIAQAIIHDPKVLILDEPTSGLDPKQIVDIRAMIKDLAGNHTIILSTHILPEVTMTCNRVLIINRGRIAAHDTLDHMTAKMNLEEAFIKIVSGEEEGGEFLSNEAGGTS